ncbi:hypothetical protein [Clostridium perfringens]|uniref:hypothetical protein n=1 Tax=Clostridium perfringens TaxID=1502 RepID=UPI001F1CE0C5|nr:hypothetical protein [Clostridium perfringens]
MEQKEALEYLVELGLENNPIVRVDGLGVYSKNSIKKNGETSCRYFKCINPYRIS